MLNGSMCAMGGMTPYPVLSALNHFPQDFSSGDFVKGNSKGNSGPVKKDTATGGYHA
jgi:hypothetical protein